MTSAIAPITGRFRRKLLFDIVGSLSLGTVFASYYYYNLSRPVILRAQEHDRQTKEKTLAEAEQWFKENNYHRN
ncbi:hypothetical protein EDD86DRAFT_242271 [Gorgonomyces haynaldii]|nr:hypothetical protein EDD86DRAFT_242271 [Gorgonomyces haynaldii]